MELRAFAERVLFAESLEEKLEAPGVVVDEDPGVAIRAPAAPGRPRGLRFKERGEGRAGFPGLHRLEDLEVRGRVLHFFANHELLATELMALVLLRFPEAPPAFRRGVLQTLRDEQEHTRLYLARMRACGVEFGELPVSGYFWRAISGMADPMDYVAGLSLTFEQANLDFAGRFARGFGAVGDEITAALLERIHRDEIAHVAYGLKWFRRWKDAGTSDWEAYCGRLKFPLSPERAKSEPLDVEGRLAAGLGRDFIERLQVYARSKGRTPVVHVFNPFAEGYLGGGPGFTPSRRQAELALDLANLPQFVCRRDDLVLVERPPSTACLAALRRVGFELPEFMEVGEEGLRSESALRAGLGGGLVGRKLGGFRPWAWGPDSVWMARALRETSGGGLEEAASGMGDGVRELYSKAWSAGFLRRVLAGHPGVAWLCGIEEVGVSVRSLEEAEAAIREIRGRGHFRVVAKESYGLAGHNALRLWEAEVGAAAKRWMERALARGHALVVEPWLERVVDFSIQLEMGARGLRLLGYTRLRCDARGGYLGNEASPAHGARIPSEVVEAFTGAEGMEIRIGVFYRGLFSSLEVELRRAGYAGPVGVDAFVYRAGSGEVRLKPVVEINPRHTMGRVLVELMRRVCPGSAGRLRLVRVADAKRRGFERLEDWVRSMVEGMPCELEGDPVPKIREGTVCLTDAGQARWCAALFEVARRLREW